MILEGSNISPAIGWVREDLDDSLATIREELEAFAEDTGRKEPMEAVRAQREKLTLTFQTRGQQGAAILTDEMTAVSLSLIHLSEPTRLH